MPPWATYVERMSRMIALETGSTASNGSSSTSSRGEWIIAPGEHDLLDHAGGVVRDDAAERVGEVERAREIGGATLDDGRTAARAARRSSAAAGGR